jgi:hypothetical protein
MTLDWTQPVIDARDMDADPLFDSQGRVQACRVGSVVYAQPAFDKLGLRNVPPPKPEPVLREAWLVWNSEGGRYTPFNIEDDARDLAERVGGVYARAAAMSDGSPVPGAEATALEIEAARDAWRTRCKQWAAKASEWAIEKDALKASLEEARCQRDDASARAEALQADVDRMKPVVDAAVIWERRFSQLSSDRLVVAVRAYQQTPKKNAAEAVAKVVEMMGPVKNCKSCGALSHNACCKKGMWSECIHSEYGNWEPRHD